MRLFGAGAGEINSFDLVLALRRREQKPRKRRWLAALIGTERGGEAREVRAIGEGAAATNHAAVPNRSAQ